MVKSFTPPFSNRSIFICLVACCGLSFQVLAQERIVIGAVTSFEDKSLIAGVKIVVKGTTVGTLSNADEGYSLTVPAEAETLVSIGHNR